MRYRQECRNEIVQKRPLYHSDRIDRLPIHIYDSRRHRASGKYHLHACGTSARLSLQGLHHPGAGTFPARGRKFLVRKHIVIPQEQILDPLLDHSRSGHDVLRIRRSTGHRLSRGDRADTANYLLWDGNRDRRRCDGYLVPGPAIKLKEN